MERRSRIVEGSTECSKSERNRRAIESKICPSTCKGGYRVGTNVVDQVAVDGGGVEGDVM